MSRVPIVHQFILTFYYILFTLKIGLFQANVPIQIQCATSKFSLKFSLSLHMNWLTNGRYIMSIPYMGSFFLHSVFQCILISIFLLFSISCISAAFVPCDSAYHFWSFLWNILIHLFPLRWQKYVC